MAGMKRFLMDMEERAEDLLEVLPYNFARTSFTGVYGQHNASVFDRVAIAHEEVLEAQHRHAMSI